MLAPLFNTKKGGLTALPLYKRMHFYLFFLYDCNQDTKTHFSRPIAAITHSFNINLCKTVVCNKFVNFIFILSCHEIFLIVNLNLPFIDALKNVFRLIFFLADDGIRKAQKFENWYFVAYHFYNINLQS